MQATNLLKIERNRKNPEDFPSKQEPSNNFYKVLVGQRFFVLATLFCPYLLIKITNLVWSKI